MFNEILVFFASIKDIILVLVGAICATLGGLISTWYQAKITRKIRREEIIGEIQVEAYQKAARVASQMQSILLQSTLENARRFVQENGNWFWEKRLFLPQGFQNKWCSIKAHLSNAGLLEEEIKHKANDKEREKPIKDLVNLKSSISRLAQDAEKEILEELGISPIQIEEFSEMIQNH